MTIVFRATGTTRQYSIENAPLKRVVFRPGENVRGEEDREAQRPEPREPDWYANRETAAGIFHRPVLIQYRRMIGLWTFAYGFAHMAMFVGVDQFFDWGEIGKQVTHNKFIISGMIALTAMLPLAITSTRGWVRRMTYKRWQMLHRLIYISAICGVIHYYWLVKSAVYRPLTYGAIVAALLLWRLLDRNWSRPAPAREMQPRAQNAQV